MGALMQGIAPMQMCSISFIGGGTERARGKRCSRLGSRKRGALPVVPPIFNEELIFVDFYPIRSKGRYIQRGRIGIHRGAQASGVLKLPGCMPTLASLEMREEVKILARRPCGRA